MISSSTLFIFVDKKRKQILKWPQTTAQVINSKITTTSAPGPRHYAVVEYTYQIAGRDYTSSGFSNKLQDGKIETAQAILSRYPVGNTVTVYYNPNKPEQALLERTTQFSPLMQFRVGMSYVLILIGIFVLLVGIMAFFNPELQR